MTVLLVAVDEAHEQSEVGSEHVDEDRAAYVVFVKNNVVKYCS
jgi:hypothetical protein